MWTVGAVLGLSTGVPWWFWFVLVLFLGIWTPAVLMGHARHGTSLVLLMSLLVAAGHSSRTQQAVPHTDISSWLGSNRKIPATIQGVVLSVDQNSGTFEAISVRDQEVWVPVQGVIRLFGSLDPIQGGQKLEIHGRLSSSYRHRWSCSLVIVDSNHITRIEEAYLFTQWRSSLQAWAEEQVASSKIRVTDEDRLIRAVVLGVRDQSWNRVVEPFRQTGTAHLLAVSGLHLAIFCGAVGSLMAALGFSHRVVTFAWIASSLIMVLIADVRTPLFRAVLMVIAASLFSIIGWRLSAKSILSMAVLIIQMIDPLVVLQVGFQLSFSVVWSFIFFLPMWMSRIRKPNPELKLSRFGQLWRVSMTAWLIATPLSVHHFGMFSLLGVPGTLLLLPLTTAVLLCGFVRLFVFWSSNLDLVISWLLEASAWLLYVIANWMTGLPGAGLVVERPSWIWVIFVEIASILMIVSNQRSIRICSAVLVATLWWWTGSKNVH